MAATVVSIINSIERDGTTLYEISCADASGRQWTCHQRFSAFSSLRDGLEANESAFAKGFPSKLGGLFASGDDVKASRQRSLDGWLRSAVATGAALAADHRTQASELLAAFLAEQVAGGGVIAAAAGGGGQSWVCSHCAAAKPKAGFSSAQLKKKDLRRCKVCIEGGQPPASPADERVGGPMLEKTVSSKRAEKLMHDARLKIASENYEACNRLCDEALALPAAEKDQDSGAGLRGFDAEINDMKEEALEAMAAAKAAQPQGRPEISERTAALLRAATAAEPSEHDALGSRQEFLDAADSGEAAAVCGYLALILREPPAEQQQQALVRVLLLFLELCKDDPKRGSVGAWRAAAQEAAGGSFEQLRTFDGPPDAKQGRRPARLIRTTAIACIAAAAGKPVASPLPREKQGGGRVRPASASEARQTARAMKVASAEDELAQAVASVALDQARSDRLYSQSTASGSVDPGAEGSPARSRGSPSPGSGKPKQARWASDTRERALFEDFRHGANGTGNQKNSPDPLANRFSPGRVTPSKVPAGYVPNLLAPTAASSAHARGARAIVERMTTPRSAERPRSAGAIAALVGHPNFLSPTDSSRPKLEAAQQRRAHARDAGPELHLPGRRISAFEAPDPDLHATSRPMAKAVGPAPAGLFDKLARPKDWAHSPGQQISADERHRIAGNAISSGFNDAWLRDADGGTMVHEGSLRPPGQFLSPTGHVGAPGDAFDEAIEGAAWRLKKVIESTGKKLDKAQVGKKSEQQQEEFVQRLYQQDNFRQQRRASAAAAAAAEKERQELEALTLKPVISDKAKQLKPRGGKGVKGLRNRSLEWAQSREKKLESVRKKDEEEKRELLKAAKLEISEMARKIQTKTPIEERSLEWSAQKQAKLKSARQREEEEKRSLITGVPQISEMGKAAVSKLMSPILAQSPPKGKPPGCTFFPQTNRGDRGAGQRLKDAVLDAEKAVHAAQGLRDEKRAELAATKKKKLRPAEQPLEDAISAQDENIKSQQSTLAKAQAALAERLRAAKNTADPELFARLSTPVKHRKTAPDSIRSAPVVSVPVASKIDPDRISALAAPGQQSVLAVERKNRAKVAAQRRMSVSATHGQTHGAVDLARLSAIASPGHQATTKGPNVGPGRSALNSGAAQ